MRSALVLILAVACGGPSQRQLAETPSATTRARPTEAPAASTSDKDRERAVQQFDDMQTTQDAYRQARGENPAPESVTKPPVKTGPAEQAPPQPKKKGPAEQAPPQPK